MSSSKTTQTIPVSGNAFITEEGEGSTEVAVTTAGITNWDSPSTIWSLFFRLDGCTHIVPSLRLSPKQEGSTFKVTFSNRQRTSLTVKVPKSDEGEVVIPVVDVPVDTSGYVRVDFQGLTREGTTFGNVSHMLLTCKEGKCVFNLEQDSYFGRRGPSVHLSFACEERTEYFYNEVTVPPGYDHVGMYAMATGFSGGYFGMQVNSEEERRLLFSVWSDYNSDDPSHVPEEYKVEPLLVGSGVHVGEFGDEGCGAKSILRFAWESGATYKFLVLGRPLDSNNTIYAAWFKSPGDKIWRLIACFRKPMRSTFLQGLYCFLENFDPDQGHLERLALFQNQITRSSDGKWHEIFKAYFTGDDTSKKGRRDFAGGVITTPDGSSFYLKHCGFFSNFVPTGQYFYINPKKRKMAAAEPSLFGRVFEAFKRCLQREQQEIGPI